MHILTLISYKVFPAQMGGQKGIADFYYYLSAYNKITILASNNNKLEDIPFESKYNCLFPQGKGIFNIFKLPFVLQLIRNKQIDIIIVEHSYWGWYGYLLRMITGKPFVIHSHNIEALRFKMQGRIYWRIYAWYEKKIHQLCNYQFFKCGDDAAHAYQYWYIPISKLTIIPYGTHLDAPPEPKYKKVARNLLLFRFNLTTDTCLLLFNGTLDYAPNREALEKIIHTIVPALKSCHFPFCLFICGKYLPEELQQQLDEHPEIHYLGYVDKFELIIAGVDALILPGIMATGVKTKMIEALGLDTTVITTQTGARGIYHDIDLKNLICIPDDDEKAFTQKIMSLNQSNNHSPKTFYERYYWGNVVKMAHVMLLKANGELY